MTAMIHWQCAFEHQILWLLEGFMKILNDADEAIDGDSPQVELFELLINCFWGGV